jgi:hypothetical protein
VARVKLVSVTGGGMRRNLAAGAVTLSLGALMATIGTGESAQAQSIFCPSSINQYQSNIVMSGGTCTNVQTNPKGVGAFSNAALASEALSDVTQATTQQANASVATTLGTRRQTELDRCPDGFERVNGVCERIVTAETPATAPPPVSPPTQTAPPQTRNPPAGGGEAVPPPRRPALIYKAPPPPPLEPAVRYSSWVQGIGDYEHRTGTALTSINCCQAAGSASSFANTLYLSGESRATMGGFLAGADATWRNLWVPGDGIITGVLTGYMSSDVRLTTTSISGTPSQVGNGSSNLMAHLDGPSVGAYVTYFRDRFSVDATFRADFFDLTESFTDNQFYTINLGPGTYTPFLYAASGSTQVTNFTTSGNVNYRFPLTAASWVEPTAGVQLTYSDYDASAAALGLTNGHLIKVQGGARYGFDSYFGNARLTTSITGLAYSDVDVTGGFIQNVAFGNNALIINDQGLLRGEGILAFNLAYADGVSLFALGDVRGGKDLFGVGGKAGVRYQW